MNIQVNSMKMKFYILSPRAFSCSHFRGRINTSANQGYFDSYFPSHSKVGSSLLSWWGQGHLCWCWFGWTVYSAQIRWWLLGNWCQLEIDYICQCYRIGFLIPENEVENLWLWLTRAPYKAQSNFWKSHKDSCALGLQLPTFQSQWTFWRDSGNAMGFQYDFSSGDDIRKKWTFFWEHNLVDRYA